MSDADNKFEIKLVLGASIAPSSGLSVEKALELADKHNDGVIEGYVPMTDAAIVMCDGAVLHGLGDHPKFEG